MPNAIFVSNFNIIERTKANRMLYPKINKSEDLQNRNTDLLNLLFIRSSFLPLMWQVKMVFHWEHQSVNSGELSITNIQHEDSYIAN